ECFRGLHARIDALARGQETSLRRLRRTLAEPKRAVDVFSALFARPIGEIDVPLLGMATGEGIACLNHLVHRGGVTRALLNPRVAPGRGNEPARCRRRGLVSPRGRLTLRSRQPGFPPEGEARRT